MDIKKKPVNRQNTYVTVLSKEGKVLEPTNRCGHIRYLIKSGKAKVVKGRPFTIQLLYECPDEIEGETLGIDLGRTNIGLSTVKDNKECTLLIEVETRNKEVPKLMEERKGNRRKHRDFGRRNKRQRRAKKNGTIFETKEKEIKILGCEKPITCKWIKNKEARFKNRKREEGWLTPTANHLLKTHLNLIEEVKKIRPIKRISLEINKFSFMELETMKEGINFDKIDYQKGKLYGLKDLHDYIDKKQNCKCLLCSQREIRNYHHIIPKAEGGSNTVENIAGLCIECHEKVHKDSNYIKRLQRLKKGIKKQYAGTSILNTIIPRLVEEIVERYPEIEINLTTGYETKRFREENRIEKNHKTDAYCIACSGIEETKEDVISVDIKSNKIKQYRRQDRQCVLQENIDRKYYKDNKVVAVNRHKRIGQTVDSLEEYRKKHTEKEIVELKVKTHLPTYKNRNRVMPGALIKYTEKKKGNKEGYVKKFILNSTKGFHRGKPDYYISTEGKKYLVSRCEVISKNSGLVFV